MGIVLLESGSVAKKKVGSKGRPRTSKRDDVPVKVDRAIVNRAKFIAATRRIPLAEYISETLRAAVDRDFRAAGGIP